MMAVRSLATTVIFPASSTKFAATSEVAGAAGVRLPQGSAISSQAIGQPAEYQAVGWVRS